MLRSASRAALGIAVAAACVVGLAPGTAAAARSCGTTHGLHVSIIRGAVNCKTAKHVFVYALGHHSGNTPAGPRGWSCYRSGGVRLASLTCASPSQANPRRVIRAR